LPTSSCLRIKKSKEIITSKIKKHLRIEEVKFVTVDL
jgi:hypothetical protein